ncbi:hypothetical protein E4U55_002398 [Claviceps digitariae]|nr:hypothetical protein E4U55_002398 [Claviceps digitariae]
MRLATLLAKSPSDTVILASVRTPICRAYKGRLRDAYPEQLLAAVLAHILDTHSQSQLALHVQDIAVGVVLSELGGCKAARMSVNHVGFRPELTTVFTVNRACASSLQAIATVAAHIRAGMIAVGIGAGMESMTRNYGSRAVPGDVWPLLRGRVRDKQMEDDDDNTKHVRDCLMPMGQTAENVASRYGVSRADQDAFAEVSHLRAARARREAWFDAEIVPVQTPFRGSEEDHQEQDGEKTTTITVTADDGIRDDVSLAALARLKPAFSPDGSGTCTAGNSSQMSDGAAATLLMRRSTATQLGLADRIIGKFVSAVAVGCAPDEMGVGPALAIPRLLNQHGLHTADVDRWEINEAFASQALYCVRELGLEHAWESGRVNPTGGAIALGHPLGATGARMTSTLLHGMRRDGHHLGVVSMCVGTGMGMAGLFVRE